MFNNCNSTLNGELLFYNSIKKNMNIIFDVGSRYDSEFLDFNGEVHYFDPVEKFMNELKNKHNKNIKSVYNIFGLSDETKDLYYYPKYESFYDRINSCKISDDVNKTILSVKNQMIILFKII